jgi:hypothetical protein
MKRGQAVQHLIGFVPLSLLDQARVEIVPLDHNVTIPAVLPTSTSRANWNTAQSRCPGKRGECSTDPLDVPSIQPDPDAGIESDTLIEEDGASGDGLLPDSILVFEWQNRSGHSFS